MSFSSESDVTIPIQDSPEPSPPQGLKSSGRGGGGVDNKGYVSKDEKCPHTSLVVETPLDSNIVNLIPAKPSPNLGPFEPLNDYFIPINHHKKFLRRSEKLYVTKSKKQGRSWGRVLCGGFGCFILAGLIAVAVLVILDVLHLPSWSTGEQVSELMASSISPVTPTSTPTSLGTSPDHLSTDNATTSASITTIYLKNTADVEFSLENGKYEAALSNKSSTPFNVLALQLQILVVEMLGESIQHESVVAKVQEFTPESGGSIYTKLRIGWSDEALTLQGLQYALRNVTSLGLGTFSVKRLKYFDVVNLCKFSNNGCSHNCSFNTNQLQFQCSCPDPFLLAIDLKTCVQVTDEVMEDSTTMKGDTSSSGGGEADATTTSTTTTTEQTPTPASSSTTTPTSSSTTTPTTTTTTTPPDEVPSNPTISSTTTTSTTTTVTTATTLPPVADEATTSSEGQEETQPEVTEEANKDIESEAEPIITSTASTPVIVESVTESELGGDLSDVGQTEKNDLDKNTSITETETAENMIEIGTTTITPPEEE